MANSVPTPSNAAAPQFGSRCQIGAKNFRLFSQWIITRTMKTAKQLNPKDLPPCFPKKANALKIVHAISRLVALITPAFSSIIGAARKKIHVRQIQ